MIGGTACHNSAVPVGLLEMPRLTRTRVMTPITSYSESLAPSQVALLCACPRKLSVRSVPEALMKMQGWDLVMSPPRPTLKAPSDLAFFLWLLPPSTHHSTCNPPHRQYPHMLAEEG